jgi:hypothetical protein
VDEVDALLGAESFENVLAPVNTGEFNPAPFADPPEARDGWLWWVSNLDFVST